MSVSAENPFIAGVCTAETRTSSAPTSLPGSQLSSLVRVSSGSRWSGTGTQVLSCPLPRVGRRRGPHGSGTRSTGKHGRTSTAPGARSAWAGSRPSAHQLNQAPWPQPSLPHQLSVRHSAAGRPAPQEAGQGAGGGRLVEGAGRHPVKVGPQSPGGHRKAVPVEREGRRLAGGQLGRGRGPALAEG